MKNKIFICLGLLLLTFSLSLTFYYLWEARQAADNAGKIAAQIRSVSQARKQESTEPQEGQKSSLKTEASFLEIDGNRYIGTLSIPALELTLPVMADWNDEKLKLAVCRYSGSVSSENLILAAHNYPDFFGKLYNLEVGDTVTFTDIKGKEYQYEVMEWEELGEADFAEMDTGDWQLTLFTCTLDGQHRFTVRCKSKNSS